MGMEIDAAGDLVTAGLVAKEVEGDGGQAAGKAHHAPCANCGTPVTAHYCGNCGQKGHLHKSVLHLGEELIHGLLHFDTKGWRTMPLLMVRPGELTRRLTLQAPVETADGAGGATRSFADVTTLWAKVEPVSARYDIVAAGTGATVTHRITIRGGIEITTRNRFTEGA